VRKILGWYVAILMVLGAICAIIGPPPCKDVRPFSISIGGEFFGVSGTYCAD
jgi:hypothetical protein